MQETLQQMNCLCKQLCQTVVLTLHPALGCAHLARASRQFSNQALGS